MIRGFAAIDDASVTPAVDALDHQRPELPSASPSTAETPEALEVRLSAEYRVALRAVAAGRHLQAQGILVALLDAMPPSPAAALLHLRYAASKNLAESCEAINDFDAALAAYQVALQDDPTDVLLWVRAADLAAETGNISAARHALEAALSHRPGHWLCIQRLEALSAVATLVPITPARTDAVSKLTRSRVKRRRRDAQHQDSTLDWDFSPVTLRLDQPSIPVLATLVSSQLLDCLRPAANRSLSAPIQIICKTCPLAADESQLSQTDTALDDFEKETLVSPTSDGEDNEAKDAAVVTRRSRRIANEETRTKRCEEQANPEESKDDQISLEDFLVPLLRRLGNSPQNSVPSMALVKCTETANLFIDLDVPVSDGSMLPDLLQVTDEIAHFLRSIEHRTFYGTLDLSRVVIRWLSRQHFSLPSDSCAAVTILWSHLRQYSDLAWTERSDLLFVAECFLPFESVQTQTSVSIVNSVAEILHRIEPSKCRESSAEEDLLWREQIIRGNMSMARKHYSKARDYYELVLAWLESVENQRQLKVGPNLSRLLDCEAQPVQSIRLRLQRRIDSIQRNVTKEKTRQLFQDKDFLGVFDILGPPFLNLSLTGALDPERWRDIYDDVNRLGESCRLLGDFPGCLWVDSQVLRGLLQATAVLSGSDDRKLVSQQLEKTALTLCQRCKDFPLRATDFVLSHLPSGPSGITLQSAVIETAEVLALVATHMEKGFQDRKNFGRSERTRRFPRMAVSILRLLLAMNSSSHNNYLALDVTKFLFDYISARMPLLSRQTNRTIVNCYSELLKKHLSQFRNQNSLNNSGSEEHTDQRRELLDVREGSHENVSERKGSHRKLTERQDGSMTPLRSPSYEWDSLTFSRGELAGCMTLLYGIPNLELPGKQERFSKLSLSGVSFVRPEKLAAVPAALSVFQFYRNKLCSMNDRKGEAEKAEVLLDALQEVASSAQDAQDRVVGRLSSQTIKQAVTGLLTSVDSLVSTWDLAEKPRSEIDKQFTDMLYIIHLLRAVGKIKAFENEFKFVRDVVKRLGDYREHYEKLKDAAIEIRKALTFRPYCTELWLMLSYLYTEYCVGLIDNIVLLESDQKDRKVFVRSFTKELSKSKRCIHLAREIATGDWGRPFGPRECLIVSQLETWFPGGRPLSESGRQLLSSCGIAAIVLLRNQALVAFDRERRSQELLSESLREYQKARDLLNASRSEFPERSRTLLSLISFRISRLKRKVGNYSPHEYLVDAEQGFRLMQGSHQVDHIYNLFAMHLKLVVEFDYGHENLVLVDYLEDTPKRFDHLMGEGANTGNMALVDPSTTRERLMKVAMRATTMLQKCRQKESTEFGEYYFKSSFAIARAKLDLFDDPSGAAQEMSHIFVRSRETLKCRIWNYRYIHAGCLPLIECERKFVYWKCKLVRFYSRVLLRTGDQERLFLLLTFLTRKLSDRETFDDGDTLFEVAENTAGMIDIDREAETVAVCENSMNILWRILRIPMLDPAQREKFKSRLANIYEQYKQRVREGESKIPTVVSDVIGATKFCLMKWG